MNAFRKLDIPKKRRLGTEFHEQCATFVTRIIIHLVLIFHMENNDHSIEIFTNFIDFFLQNLDLDDNELKNLLDEAYSYKGPKDKENKSDIFKVCSIPTF